MYKVEIVKKLRNSETGIVINPTHSEYYNKISKYFSGDTSVNDNEDTYEMRIRFFATINKVVNNIQHIYTGNAEYNNGVYTTIINNRQVVLTPFYSGFDQSYDKLFNHHTLINQPGFDWIDIKDLDDTIQNINYNDENDYINILDINDVHNNDEYKNDDDIAHILSYRKLMILNVTTRLINSVKNYEHTNIFNDYSDKYKNDHSNDNINITFKINSNQNDSDDNDVKIKTILRAKYSENGKDHYEYYDDIFSINGILKIKTDASGNDTCYIDCELGNDPFINHRLIDDETNETIIRKYDEFIVFFVIVPNEINNNKEFEIDRTSPRIIIRNADTKEEIESGSQFDQSIKIEIYPEKYRDWIQNVMINGKSQMLTSHKNVQLGLCAEKTYEIVIEAQDIAGNYIQRTVNLEIMKQENSFKDVVWPIKKALERKKSDEEKIEDGMRKNESTGIFAACFVMMGGILLLLFWKKRK